MKDKPFVSICQNPLCTIDSRFEEWAHKAGYEVRRDWCLSCYADVCLERDGYIDNELHITDFLGVPS